MRRSRSRGVVVGIALVCALAPSIARAERVGASCSGLAPSEYTCEASFVTPSSKVLVSAGASGLLIGFAGAFRGSVSSDTAYIAVYCHTGVVVNGCNFSPRIGDFVAGQEVTIEVTAAGVGRWSVSAWVD